jgi:hypothetical protein
MDNLDEFLGEAPEDAEAVTPEVVETPEVPEGETPEQKATRERDEKGRFKAKEQTDDVMVPLKALHETRDEVKALKAELEKLRQPVQQQEAVPDIFENPEGYAAFLQNQIAQVSLNDRLNVSEEMVRQSEGEEIVNAAQEWGRQLLAANPAFAQTFYGQRNPYGFLVGEYKRQQSLSQLGNLDPATIEQFVKWREAQSAPQPAPAPVPTTLADAQSARSASETFSPPSLDQILGRST